MQHKGATGMLIAEPAFQNGPLAAVLAFGANGGDSTTDFWSEPSIV